MKMILQTIVFIIFSVIIILFNEYNSDANEEYIFDSLYNHVIVLRNDSIVSFRRMENGATLSAIDIKEPARQIISYNKTLFAPVFFKNNPKRVLSIGLGAGSFNRLFNVIYPTSELVTVEIDIMILRLAKEFTNFTETDHNRVIIQDGRMFLKRDTTNWDWIIIDAFIKRSQIPPHLTTVEFYEIIADRLAPDGIMATNLHSGNKLFNSHVATLKKVFPQVLFFNVPNSGNVIAVCANYSKPDLYYILQTADTKSMPDLTKYDVVFSGIKNSFISPSDNLINQPGQVLIDDFAPVEFLEFQNSSF